MITTNVMVGLLICESMQACRTSVKAKQVERLEAKRRARDDWVWCVEEHLRVAAWRRHLSLYCRLCVWMRLKYIGQRDEGIKGCELQECKRPCC